MWIFFDKNTGREIYRSGVVMRGGQIVLVKHDAALKNALKYAPNYTEANLTAHQAKTLQEAESLLAVPTLIATIQAGVITNVGAPPSPPTLWVHVTLSGGTTSSSGTLYIKNDGVDALTVQAHLRDGPEVATSAAVTHIETQPISDQWALELVNVDTGALADTPLVQMSAGVIDVSYTTTIAPCEVELAEDRLQSIGGYMLKLAQTVRFKIVRALS